MNRSMWNKAAARHRDNKRDSLANGKFIGPTPFGYRKQRGRLVEHPDEAPIVREAFARAARGGIAAARDHFEAATRDNPNVRERIWRMDMTRKLIGSKTYLGEHAKRGLVAGVDPETGRTIPYPPHDALVSFDVWTAAQHAPRPRRDNSEYLLTQLVFCECGAHLVGQSQLGKQRRYRCSNGHYSCTAELLNEHIREGMRAALADRVIRERVQPRGVDEALRRLETAKTARRRYQLALDNLDDVDDAAWAEGAAAVEKRVKNAHDAYQTLIRQSKQSEQLPLASEMDDDDSLRLGLRILAADGLRIVVARGAGSLDARVRLVDDLEDAARTLAS
jgi:hypothetical protein